MKNTCEIEPRPKTIRGLLVSARFWKSVNATIIGAILGYLYFHFTNDTAQTSTFMSTPLTSILSGGFLGWFFVNRPCAC